MKAVTLILFLVLIPFINAQDVESLNSKFEEYNRVESKYYTWSERNILIDIKSTVLGELFSPRDMNIEVYEISDYSDIDTSRFVDRNLLVNLIGYGVEPRMNLLNKSNYSIGLKTSFYLNFSIYSNFGSNIKSTGYTHINSTGLIYFAKGLSSTFNSTSENGFSISGGVMYLRAPLLGNKSSYVNKTTQKYEFTESSDQFLRKNWILPLVQFDYYRLNSDFKVRNLSVSFGYINQNTYFRFNYGVTF